MISVIIPVYNEERNIIPFYSRIKDVLSLNKLNHELIFVDDHSYDNSFKILSDLAKKDNNLKVIRLSKNQGNHIAITAGLANCRGDYACCLSCDFQDPPELIQKMHVKALEGFDIVWGYRKKRKDSFYRKFISLVYKSIIKNFTKIKNFNAVCDIFCISKKVIDNVNDIDIKNASLFMVILDMGFRQCQIPYIRGKRRVGKSKYTISKKLKLLGDSFFPFSYFPIQFIMVLGFLTALLAAVYAIVIFYKRVFKGNLIMGWSSTMLAILFFASIQLIMLGVMGEYLRRTHDKSSKDKIFYIERSINLDGKSLGENKRNR